MSGGRWWPETLKPCGTNAAYRRHLRHHEPPCRPCLDAHNQATRPPDGILTFNGDLTSEQLDDFKARWEALQSGHPVPATEAMMTPEPMFTWDANAMARWEHWREASTWAAEHFPDRARYTFRADFYLIDTAFAVLYRYEALDGHVQADPGSAGNAKLAEPATVLLSELPPAHLRMTP